MKIRLKAVFLYAIDISSGPNILLFKRSKNIWNTIKFDNFTTITSNASIINASRNITADTIIFDLRQFDEFQIRDDYKELLNLCIIFFWKSS